MSMKKLNDAFAPKASANHHHDNNIFIKIDKHDAAIREVLQLLLIQEEKIAALEETVELLAGELNG